MDAVERRREACREQYPVGPRGRLQPSRMHCALLRGCSCSVSPVTGTEATALAVELMKALRAPPSFFFATGREGGDVLDAGDTFSR